MKKKPIFEDKFYPPDLDLDDDLDDEEVFRLAMSDVTRLPEAERKVSVRQISEGAASARSVPEPEEDPERLFLQAMEGDNQSEFFLLNEYVEGGTQAWDSRLLKKLREGGFAVQAELDLHGFSQREAVMRLEEFVLDCCRRGFTCVRVIHGKGKNSPGPVPLLKNRVERWLSRRSSSRYVVAYTSARLVDGGGGAMYVLLRCS